MNDAVFVRQKHSFTVPEQLVVLLFFAWGSAFSCFGLINEQQLLSQRLFLSVLLALLFVSASSGLGWLLIPMAMLAFGVYSEWSVLEWLSEWSDHSFPALSPLIFQLFLTPIVLLAGMCALRSSDALRAAIVHASPSARGEYQKEIVLSAVLVLLGLSGVFYFT